MPGESQPTHRSIGWPLLLAAAVSFLCAAHPILAPSVPASAASGARVHVVARPVVVEPDLGQILRDSIVALAREQLGTPYVLGGTTPLSGFDCSGFVRWVLSHARTRLPRTARQQALAGVPVPRTHLLPGDLLTFGSDGNTSHVGIYLGDGVFIHASSAAGRVVVSRLDRRAVGRVVPWRGIRRVLVASGG